MYTKAGTPLYEPTGYAVFQDVFAPDPVQKSAQQAAVVDALSVQYPLPITYGSYQPTPHFDMGNLALWFAPIVPVPTIDSQEKNQYTVCKYS